MTSQQTNDRLKVLLWATAAIVMLVLSWHAGHGRLRPWSIYLLLLPTFAGVMYVHRNLDNPKLRLSTALFVLVLCMFCVDMSQVDAQANPSVQNWLQRIVEDPQTTSYYTDAMRLMHQTGWVANFQNEKLSLHSSTHPVGPILFYALLIQTFGPIRATLVGPLLVGALSATTVLAMYFFSGIWTSVRKERLLICLLWTLCPAVGLVYPEFDQVYPVLSMVILAAWFYSLQKSLRYSILLGVACFIATLFAYNLLVIGTFLVCIGAGYLWIADWQGRAVARLLQSTLIAAGLIVVLHIAFSQITGYHPIDSFVHSLHVQKVIEVRPKGLYAAASNVYNYSLGSGFLPEILGIFFLVALFRSPDRKSMAWIATVAAVLTLLAVEITGVLDYEAQRVWLFLQPLIFVPAAIKLGEFSRRDQRVTLVAQWSLLATIGRSLLFVVPFH